MLFSGLDTVILRVRDVKAAQQWYQDKLGLSSIYTNEAERLSVLDIGSGATFTIWEMKQEEPRSGDATSGTYPILRVEDAQRAHDELKQRGVRVDALQDGGDVLYFRFWDADGNLLEACQVTE